MRAAPALVIRCATRRDGPALHRLAQRDSAEPPSGALLVAEVAGELRAALALDGLAVIADPFEPTAALVDLLRLRARQLRRSSRPNRRGRQALRHGRGRHRPSHRPAPA